MIEIRIKITKDYPACCSTHVYTDPVAAILGLSHTLGIATEFLKTTKKTKQSREQVNLDPRSDISKAWHQALKDARTRKQDLAITRKALEEIAKEHTGTDGKLYACSLTAQQALELIEHKETTNDK